ncbi:MAG: methyltransferase domain-containing protein [Streptosporangiaceae bacterium]|jgi:SAM-dependent methyltransferase
MAADIPAGTATASAGTDGQPSDDGAAEQRWRDGTRSSVIWPVLREVVASRGLDTGRPVLDIVDVGGGTGGLAVAFAGLGHRVTVVDPSPDALAAAQRRAAEARVPLTAVQGEADELDALIGAETADLLICHSVLEYVDSPAASMAVIARVLRPGATVSVLAANAAAAVLHKALAGRYAEAAELLAGMGQDGGAGAAPPRRFTLDGLIAVIEGAGLRAGAAHGVRVFAGLIQPAAGGTDTGAADALRALEQSAAGYPAFRDIAARLHVLGHR